MTAGPRTRRDVEVPSRTELRRRAQTLADGMRRDGHTEDRFARWIHVLDLHHRDPQLLVELVLVLTDPPERTKE